MKKETKEERDERRNVFISRATSHFDTPEIRKEAEEMFDKANPIPEEVCEKCGGTGELSCMEAVYPGEPHMADVGTRACDECQIRDEEEIEE